MKQISYFLLSLVLVGCSYIPPVTVSPLTQANLDKIHNDMSPVEVKSILGDPSDSTTEPIPVVGGTQTTYTYSGNNSDVTIVFKNDRMKEKRGAFSK